MITALVHSRQGLDALATTLSALVPAVADGLVGDAVVLAPNPNPDVDRVADAMGAALVITRAPSPWPEGAALARREWCLCLEDGDVPTEGWIRALERFIALSPPGRRFGRLARRPRTLRERLALLAPGAGRVRAGDLVHRSLLLVPNTALARPARVGARIERDPVFG